MDDRTFRIIANAAIIAAVGVFWPTIKKWLYKIGYRDWREPAKKDETKDPP